MKNICKLILVFILPILFGCKDELQRKEFLKTAKIYLSKELKNNADYKSLDSLRILKIDTLSDKDELYLYICQLYRYKNHLLSQSKSPKDLYELKYGTDDFDSQMYEDYVKLEYKSVKEKEAKFNVLRDSIDFIKKQIKHYEQILVKKDSLNLCMYEVEYSYQITNKNMITKKGETYLLFTKDMKMIEDKNLEIKNLHKFPFIK
ncbi:hypothetical protein QX233_03730 [Chryseobacterium gambrini]|uniref:Lipoprotein n=1 Tax=Chryseobacterium gambrini TaxID=373672 RepID=A0AAJ1R221_9FLAO|nr:MULTISPECIES: hypothetical protein [Chryseobacterium]MDN4011560.1 hypothetical protein [Chryseobacterium gambrini]MDN4029080.1 hypothetical protein [Chryseobacterium gambrini]QWA39243.1 hypothetical protein KKI44_03260 [Chryseobacterium sp. ZHDP1]